MSEAARSRREDARYEPSFGTSTGANAAADPLAELARIVGQDDPFRNVFRPTPRPEAGDERSAAYPEDGQESHEASHDAHWATEEGYEDHHAAVESDPDYHESGFEHGTTSDPAMYPQHEAFAFDAAADERYYAAGLAAHPDEAGIADQHAAPEAAHDAMAALPDLWARDDGRVDGYAPEIDAGSSREPDFGRSADKATARRPVAVLAAVLLLTGGGLAATFLAKGHSDHNVVVSDRGGAPTILAATGPTKIKLDDGSATAPEDQDAALLNKNGKPAAGPVKVVSSEEQPVDLAQLPKSPDVAEGAQPLPQATSPFPEPKKVKTFLVHLDGTTLDDAQALQSKSAAAPPVASVSDAGSPLPATPTTAAKGNTTPKTMTIASLATEPATADTTAPTPSRSTQRQPASPGARSVGKIETKKVETKRVETSRADTDKTDAGKTDAGKTDAGKSAEVADASVPSSGFGLQLAASPSEADAESAFAKLKKKYPSQLGPYTASIHRSETGDKPVYRVRVGGLSQADAKSLCSDLQSNGGSCFVVRN